ncbi:MAG: class I SAM-dependent methyltransferase [Oligoflexia bacterium]|nr:class I SAM-dependent methyltransferase [Oligoflexia bacterium]
MKAKIPFDKYFYYKKSVQSPIEDIKFFKKTFKHFFKKPAHIFREDFCGTFYVAYHWIKDHSKNKAIAIDADKEPIEYGNKHHLSKLKDSQKNRLKVLNKNVLDKNLPKAEIITVSNFSYFALKERSSMLKYFKNVRKALSKKGLFIIDVLGGPECEELSEEEAQHGGFSYYWDQDRFDPISRTGQFYIHFKRKGEKKREKEFSYSWRLWSLPELKDILTEAGFSKVHVYWEGSNKQGEGNGIFKQTKKGDICDTWIAYLVSLP